MFFITNFSPIFTLEESLIDGKSQLYASILIKKIKN